MLLNLPCCMLDIRSPHKAAAMMLKLKIPFEYIVQTGHGIAGFGSGNIKLKKIEVQELDVETEACKYCVSQDIGRCNLPVGKMLRKMALQRARGQR